MSQAVINALVRQRDRAMNEAAQAEARCEVLTLEVERLTAEVAELRSRADDAAATIEGMPMEGSTHGD